MKELTDNPEERRDAKDLIDTIRQIVKDRFPRSLPFLLLLLEGLNQTEISKAMKMRTKEVSIRCRLLADIAVAITEENEDELRRLENE